MGILRTELKMSKEIPTVDKDGVEHVPANGSIITIPIFEAAGAVKEHATVKLIWDYGGAGEEVIWTIHGDGKMPFSHVITDTDGTKILAVCLDNQEGSNLFMSGYALVLEE